MELALDNSSISIGLGENPKKMLDKTYEHLVDHVVPNHRNQYRPHMLSHRALMLYGMLLLSVKVAVISIGVIGPLETAYSSAITTDNVFNLTNASRQSEKLSPLFWNDKLASAAQAKADDMLAKGYFSHNSPDGKLPWDFIVSTGYNYITAGENLAEGFKQAEATETAWMNSPGHRANIMNKNFEQIGVGISEGKYQGHNTIFVVQMFGTPMDRPVKVLEQPTQVVTALTEQASTQVAQPKLEILSHRVLPSGTGVVVTVKTSSSAVGVSAVFGDSAVFLDPKEGNVWEALIPASKLREKNMLIKAWDMRGQNVQQFAAAFASDIQSNYNALGIVKGDSVKLFGYEFNPKASESKFYAILIAVLLSSLVLAIGLKRHVQHISLIANTSLVIILAVLFSIA